MRQNHQLEGESYVVLSQIRYLDWKNLRLGDQERRAGAKKKWCQEREENWETA